MKYTIYFQFKNFHAVAALLVLAVLSGCSLKSRDTSRVQIALPPETAAQLSSSAASSSLARLPVSRSLSDTFLVGTADPQAPTDFTCFGINVSGAGIPNHPTIDACSVPDMPAPGLVGGLSVVSGGTVEVDVPVGTSRTIQLFAVQSNIGCPTLTDILAGKFGSEDVGTPYEIGRTVTDIAGDAAVTIDAKWDPLNAKKIFCPKGVGVPFQIALVGSSFVITKDCSTLKAEVRDSKGDLVSLRSDLTLTLSDSDAGEFYSDSTCSASMDKTTKILAKTSSTTFYYKAGTALTHTVAVKAPGIDGSKLEVAATVPPPTQLAFSGTATLLAGACSPVQVISRDQYGVDSPVLADTSVQVKVSSGSGSLYSDQSCTLNAALNLTASIASGKSAAIVYMKGNSGGVVQLAVTDASSKLSASSFSITVNPAVPYQLAFQTQPSSSVVAGSIFGVQPQVQVQDMYGNAIATATNSVTLAVYTDSNCSTLDSGSINAGSNPVTASAGVASFSNVSYNYSGTKYIQASSSGLVSACSSAIAVAAGSPSAGNSTITVAPSSVLSDGTSTGSITITVNDAYNNPIPGITVVIAASGTGNTLTQPASVTDASGQTVGQIKSTIAGPKSISITSPSSLSSVTGTALFASGVPVAGNSSISGSSPVTADGSSTSSITITLRDGSNNPILGIVPTFGASGTNNTVGTCSSSDGAGVSTCTLSSTTAESKTIQILTPVSVAGNTVAFTAGTAAKLVFLTQPSSSGTAGHSFPTQPIVGVADANGNAVSASGGNVTLSVSTSPTCENNFGYLEQGTDFAAISAGIANFSGAKFKTPGLIYLRAQSLNLQSACSTAISLSPSGPYIAKVYGSEVVTSGNSEQMKVVILDSEGKLANVSSNTQINISPSQPVIFSDPAATSNISSVMITSGTNMASFYFKDSVSRGININLTDNASQLQGSSSMVSVVPSGSSVSGFEVSGPKDLQPNVCSAPFSIQSINSNHTVTPVSTSTSIALATTTGSANFYTDAGCTASVSTLTIPTSSSSISFYAKATAAGMVMFKANDIAGNLQPGESGFSAAYSGTTTNLSFFPEEHFSAQGCNDVTIIARDSTFSPTIMSSSKTIQLGSTGSGAFYSDSNCTSAITSVNFPPGVSLLDVKYKNNAQETVVLTATDTSNTLKTGSISMLIGPSNNGTTTPYRIALDGYNSNLAQGTCQAFRLRVKNSSWNDATVSSGQSFTATLAGSPAGRLYGSAGCTGTPLTSHPLSIAPSTGSSDTFWFSSNVNEDVQVSISTASPDFPTSSSWYFMIGSGSGTTQPVSELRISGPNTSIVNTGCEMFTVTSVDHYGRSSNVGLSTPVTVSLSGGSGGLHTIGNCSDAAQSTLNLTIAPSTNQITFYFRGLSSTGPVNLNATSAGLSGWGRGVCVTDSNGAGCGGGGGSSTLGLILDNNSSSTIPLNTCKLIRIRSVNSSGNLANVSLATPFTVTIPNTLNGRLYTGGSPCTGTPMTSVSTSIAVSTSQAADIWFQSSVNEDVAVSASTNSPDFQPSMTWFFLSGTGSGTAGSPSNLRIVGSASGIYDTGCIPLQVQATDLFGRPASVGSPISATLAFMNGNGQFYQTGACTDTPTQTVPVSISSGYMSTSVYFRPLASPGLRTIYFSTQPPTFSVSNKQVCGTDVGGNGCSNSAYKIDLDNAVVGSLALNTCRTFQLHSKNTTSGTDASMSATVNFNINLIQSGSGAYFYAGSTCTGSPVTSLSVSIPSANYLSSSVSFISPSDQDITLNVTTSDPDFQPSKSWYFMSGSGGVAQAPTHLQLNPVSNWTETNIGCLALSVSSTDHWGRAANVGGSINILLGMMSGLTGEFHMSSGCGDTALSNAMLTIPTSGNGSNTVYYRATGSYGYRYFQLSPQTGAFILNSPAVCGSDSGGNGC